MVFTSTSVESLAIDRWMVENQAMDEPLNMICLDCMERRSGVILPNVASTKTVGYDGSWYVVVSVGAHL